MGSTSAMLATTKNIVLPLVATTLYASRAVLIISSVASASFSRTIMILDVTCGRTNLWMYNYYVSQRSMKRDLF